MTTLKVDCEVLAENIRDAGEFSWMHGNGELSPVANIVQCETAQPAASTRDRLVDELMDATAVLFRVAFELHARARARGTADTPDGRYLGSY